MKRNKISRFKLYKVWYRNFFKKWHKKVTAVKLRWLCTFHLWEQRLEILFIRLLFAPSARHYFIKENDSLKSPLGAKLSDKEKNPLLAGHAHDINFYLINSLRLDSLRFFIVVMKKAPMLIKSVICLPLQWESFFQVDIVLSRIDPMNVALKS